MHSGDLLWHVHNGEGPIFAVALHSGHDLREELRERIALDEATRLREEDPFSDAWVSSADNFILPRRSRFEVDLNRSREEAAYQTAEDAWGLQVWRTPLTAEMIQHSLEEYDAFYQQLESLLKTFQQRHDKFVVFDLHTYNYRREGPHAPPENIELNPEINIGTGTMNRQRWSPVVDRFINELRNFDFLDRHLDVRENVKFRGRYFPQWVHSRFPNSACVLSIEVKKFFMDEYSGQGDPIQIQAIREALLETIPGIIKTLAQVI